jgi:DNA-binding XRE family transcriptional regulator
MNMSKSYRFSTYLKEMRTKYNMTQKDLADKLEVHHKTISSWENGNSCPNINKILKAEELFNGIAQELTYADPEHSILGADKINLIGMGAMILLIIFFVAMYFGLAEVLGW